MSSYDQWKTASPFDDQDPVEEAYELAKERLQEDREESLLKKDTLFDIFPEEDFNWEAVEAGDWHPVWMDDYWYAYAYATSASRKDGKLTVEVRSVDFDGNWDFDTDDEEEVKGHMATETYDQLLAKLEYDFWVYENGEDPLGLYYPTHSGDLIDAAAKSITNAYR